MSEADSIARCDRGPVTREWLARDLRALGVPEGGVLMVHSALSSLGWIVGAADTALAALREVVGPAGTLVVPTFTSGNSDPAAWRHPPVPAAWVETIRAEMPPFDPQTSRSRQLGRLAELVRTTPGAVRSPHPSASWAALGPRADALMAHHPVDDPFAAGTPIARCLAAGAHVLSLGTHRTSLLHHAEVLADWPGKRSRRDGCAIREDGERRWVWYEQVDSEDEDFEALRQAFMAETPAGAAWAEGPVGYGRARRFCGPALLDFACRWLPANRGATEGAS